MLRFHAANVSGLIDVVNEKAYLLVQIFANNNCNYYQLLTKSRDYLQNIVDSDVENWYRY